MIDYLCSINRYGYHLMVTRITLFAINNFSMMEQKQLKSEQKTIIFTLNMHSVRFIRTIVGHYNQSNKKS